MQTEHADLHNADGHAYLAWNRAAVAAREWPAEQRDLPPARPRLGVTESCGTISDEALGERCWTRTSYVSRDQLERRDADGCAWASPRPWPRSEGLPVAVGRLEFYCRARRVWPRSPPPTRRPTKRGRSEVARPIRWRDRARRPHFLNTEFRTPRHAHKPAAARAAARRRRGAARPPRRGRPRVFKRSR